MDLLLHFFEHALEDTLALVPFLFVTYIALEALEHAAGARANAVVRRAGAAGRLSAHCWAWSRSVASRPWRLHSTLDAW